MVALGAALLVLAGGWGGFAAEAPSPEDAAGLDAAAYVPRGTLGQAGTGGLLLDRGDRDRLLRAPMVATDVAITVGGLVARAHVRQHFRNPSDGWVEGIYVFPLPETAAVDHLRLRIGDRVVEGRIREREEARRAYDAAKREGHKAGLLESQRPNIFTTAIANIAPGEEVTVEIQYQQALRYDAGRFHLRFPMVVGPRYIPDGVRTVRHGGVEPAAGRDPVPDADRITPPVLHPDLGKINPVRLTVTLDAGFPLAEITSPYHPVTVEREDGHRHVVRLRDGPVPADRDFELVWTPDVGEVPGVALFRESLDDADYLLVMVMPPTAGPADQRTPEVRREVIFVLDTSGSMSGPSLEQAKEALVLALDRLTEGDRFNVIRFADDTSRLFRQPRPVDADTLARARRTVWSLSAEGGTEMAPALRAALSGAPPEGTLRQVIFLTDGAVGNETELFRLIDDRLGDSRLFTIGIGSAPNSHFMREAAEAGRGSFTYIGKLDEVRDRMAALFAKLERPVLTGLDAQWPAAAKAEVSTGTLPDLYAGEPVVFTARVAAADGVAALAGRRGGLSWRVDLPLSDGAETPGVAKLWARDRITDLVGQLRKGGDPDALRAAVVALGLRHRLVTRYTSLVAIDRTAARPADVPVGTEEVPLNLPHGWDPQKVFGGHPQPSPAYQRRAAAASPAGLQFAAAPVRIGASGGLGLPQGATAAPWHLLAGAALVVLGLIALVLRRRLS